VQPIDDRPNLGWREWLALPALGISAIKAKLDSGARSSSLHVEDLETLERAGVLHVCFRVRPRRRSERTVACCAPVLDRRRVTDSSGHCSERWFIRSEVQLAGEHFSVDINLTDRRHMLFPMLLGRSALMGRFAVDPALSYTQSRSLQPPRNPSS
jgi:hypothetical protein